MDSTSAYSANDQRRHVRPSMWVLAILALLVTSNPWHIPRHFAYAFGMSLDEILAMKPTLDLLATMVYVLVGFAVLYNRRSVLKLARHFWFFIPVVIAAGFSYGWSIYPESTLSAWVDLTGASLIGILIADRFGTRQQFQLFGAVFAILAIVSFIYIIYLPEFGIHSREHIGKWRGIFQNKNFFARVSAFGLLVFALAFWRSTPTRWTWSAGAVLAAIALLGAGSRGAHIAVVACAGLAVLIAYTSRKASNPIRWVIALIGLAAVAIWFTAEPLLQMLGDDGTLNKRTQLWSLLAPHFQAHPWLGHGFDAFWQTNLPPSRAVQIDVGFNSTHSHNSFLDVALDLGALGVVLLVTPMVIVFYKALQKALANPNPCTLWPVLLLTYLLVIAQLFNTLMQTPFYWAIYVAVILAMLRKENDAPRSPEPVRGPVFVCLLLVDGLILAFSLWASVVVRYFDLTKDLASFWWIVPMGVVVSWSALYIAGAYDKLHPRRSLLRVAVIMAFASVFVGFAAQMTGAVGFPRTAPALFFLLSVALLAVNRFVLRSWIDFPRQGREVSTTR